MRNPWGLVRAVPATEWPAVLAAFLVACLVEAALRLATLPRVARWCGSPLRLDDGSAVTAASAGVLLPRWADRRLNATRRVMRHWPFGDTCLRRALVSGQRLRRLNPALRVGVAKIDDEILAHAWLEVGGMSLDPAGSQRYRALEQVPWPAPRGTSPGAAV